MERANVPTDRNRAIVIRTAIRTILRGCAATIRRPQLGESVTEETIERWLVKEGDSVEQYDPLFEVVTDKVNAEVPAEIAGTITKIIVPDGETVAVGTALAEIEDAAAGAGAEAASAEAPRAAAPAEAETPAPEPAEAAGSPAAEEPAAAAATATPQAPQAQAAPAPVATEAQPPAAAPTAAAAESTPIEAAPSDSDT